MNEQERRELDNQCYLHCFSEYKQKLIKLCVPVEDIGDAYIIKWFSEHMKSIEKGEN